MDACFARLGEPLSTTHCGCTVHESGMGLGIRKRPHFCFHHKTQSRSVSTCSDCNHIFAMSLLGKRKCKMCRRLNTPLPIWPIKICDPTPTKRAPYLCNAPAVQCEHRGVVLF